MDILEMHEKIRRLGEEIANCRENCKGIKRNREDGTIPRGLFLEIRKGEKIGCIVVGTNPGPIYVDEKAEFLKSPEYASEEKYFNDNYKEGNRGGKKPMYFNLTRDFIKETGIEGSILWTDLCKCEDEKLRVIQPTVQTFRVCMNKFLRKELALISEEIPIIALGRKAAEYMPIVFPDRRIIGIPHPTGAQPNFRRLFEGRKLRENFKDEIRKALESNGPFFIEFFPKAPKKTDRQTIL